MIAAERIFIWLPVRLVRRSSISNMAFFPLAHVRFFSGRRAYTQPVPGMLRSRCGERKPIETEGAPAHWNAARRRPNPVRNQTPADWLTGSRRLIPGDRGLRPGSSGGEATQCLII